MHGISLTLLQDSVHRKIASGLARKRHIKREKASQVAQWNVYEGFTKEEFLKIGIYKRFLKL
jgi:hypothetical protein